MLVCGIGEILWDVFADKERFGGAALNFCAHLHRLGHTATLLSAVGKDERGRMALEQMRSLGLSTEGVQEIAELPTGIASIGVGLDGDPTFVIPRPAAFDAISVDIAPLATMKSAGVGWLYFGTLLQTKPEIERLTTGLVQQFHPARRFYDLNLRTGQWNLPLVQRLSSLASIMKLNEGEARTLYGLTTKKPSEFSLGKFCRIWASTHRIDVICVTLGSAGCMIYDRGEIYRVAGYEVTVRDTVGSGDAFAAAFLHGYDRGWPIRQTARFANALGALVASRAGATPNWTVSEVLAMCGAAESGNFA